MMNRMWRQHFGRGLVDTPSDFGMQTDEPLHAELLDWLAARFVEEGWSMKAMHRLHGAFGDVPAGELRERGPGPSLKKDPENRYLGADESAATGL